MESWFWFALWLVLGVGALSTFTLIALSLRDRAAKLRVELDIAQARAFALTALSQSGSDYQGPESDLGKDPALSMRKRLNFLGSREAKRRARERRLIEHLKHIEIDESRFS